MEENETKVIINYRDPEVCREEFGGLVELARSFGATSLPVSSNCGTLNFRYDSRRKAVDFYHAAIDGERFHFNSGEIPQAR